MTDGQTPPGRKTVHPVFFLAPAIAIVAGVGAVFISTSNPAREQAAPPSTQEASGGDVVAEPAQIPGAPAQAVQPPAAPADAGSATSPDGSAITFVDEAISFSAALPPGPPNDPNLAALRKDAQNYLATKKAEAQSQYQDYKKHGGPPAWPWEVMITWEYTARAGDVVSLFGSSYEFTGGAHGMTRFDTLIARNSGEKLSIEGMLQGGLSPAIVIAVCEALKLEKKKRIDTPTILDEPIVCAGPNANVKIDRAKLVLAPSNQTGKFGGLYAYYEPYEVGAYAEGSYVVTIPQEIFAQDLKPAFKPLFAGEPPPPKD